MASSPDDVESAPKADTVVPKSPAFFTRDWLLGPVDITHGDLVLLSHSMASGMVDAASFSNWEAFVAMQTGNTVLLGLSTADVVSNPYAWLTTLTSILSYLVGNFFAFRATRALAPLGPASNRAWLSTLFALQALLILLPAALIAADLVPHNAAGVIGGQAGVVRSAHIVALMPPLAFQAGLQIACSRLMGFNELPVNVLTSTYCDIMGDPKLFAAGNKKRDRRAASVVLLLGGAIVSTWLMKSDGGMAAALFVAGAVKLGAAVGAFLFFKAGKVVAR